MKRSYLITIGFIFILFASSAQNDSLERAIQDGFYTNYNYAIKDKTTENYYLGYNISDSLGAVLRPVISALNPDGTTLWEKDAMGGFIEGGTINKMLQVGDSNIVLSGFEYSCDVGYPIGYVQKVDRTTGNTIWLTNFEWGSPSFGNDVVELPDSGFWVANGSALYHLNSLGDSITFTNYNWGGINKMEMTAAGFVLLACDNGVLKIDGAGNPIDTLVFTNPVNHFASYNDSLYFFESGKIIYKTDSALNVVGVDSGLTTVTQFNAMKIADNELWFIVHNGGNSKLVRWDFNLSFLNEKLFNDFNGADFDVRDMIVNSPRYDLLANEKTSHSSNHLTIKKWMTTNDTTSYYNNDASVLSFYADSSFGYTDSFPGGVLVLPTFDLYVLIENNGAVPLTEVFLNTELDIGVGFCTPFVYGNKFDGLNILPGNSGYVHMGWTTFARYLSTNNPSNTVNICIWTSSPNGKMDYNHANDNSCIPLAVNRFASINENSADGLLKVYPNPVGNELTVFGAGNFSLNNSSIEISDLLGRTAIKKPVTANETKLDVSKLSPGIYSIKVKTDAHSYVQKFVKQ